MEKLTFSLNNVADVAAFFNHLILVESLNFHPDTPFADYVDEHGKPTYTHEEVQERDDMLNKCFTICENENADIYEIGMDTMTELIHSWKVL